MQVTEDAVSSTYLKRTNILNSFRAEILHFILTSVTFEKVLGLEGVDKLHLKYVTQ
jgi:hypothetical protein